jgi:hypothetical protein
MILSDDAIHLMSSVYLTLRLKEYTPAKRVADALLWFYIREMCDA